MSRVRTWLVSDKKFHRYLRAIKNFPGDCHSLFFSQSFSSINFSTFLSCFFFQNQPMRTSAPSTLRVPPTGGTLSFRRNTACCIPPVEKNILICEVEKIPARYREGLIKYLNKYRSSILLCSVFTPRTFSFDLAEKCDSYLVKKRSWFPATKQVENFIRRIASRESIFPNFSRRLTLREKLAMRILWKFRQRFVRLEEVSSYLYGKRMPKNMHASETTIFELRERLRSITGREKVLNCSRNCGYRVDEEVWKDIIEL